MLKVFASVGRQLLSDVDTLPAKMSLASFWSKLEAMLWSCYNDMPFHLATPHLHNLAPYIVGDACWRQLSGQVFVCWTLFKTSVDKEFGFTNEKE